MKAAKRSILICVLTLILSVSLLAGVTFAWFTDSITNSGNTIQSGELAIDATAYDRVDAAETDGLTVTIGEGNVASGTYYFEAEGASLRNGDPVITEENWQPGDMNAKLFTVSNEGSIDAVVSLDFFVSGDLAEAMWYDFIAVDPADGSLLGEFLQRNDLTTLQTLAADREFTLSPAADLEDGEVSQVTFLFVYGLPTSATNEAMNKAVNVNVVVSAKQNVEGAEGPVVVNPGTDLSETTIDSGDTILLSEGDYEVSQPVTVEGKQNIVIDGNGATIKASSAEGASIMSATSKSIAVAADTQTDLANNIINVSGATNVTIRNLTIVGALHHGINIWECENVVIENVTIINSDATAITINGSNVTLNSVTTSGSAWGGVNVDIAKSTEEGTLTTLTVDENCAFGEYLQIYADNATIADKVTVNATGYNKYTVTATDGNTRILWTNDSAVTEGTVFVDDAARLETAVANGGYIMFAGDINFNLAFANLAASVSINLNGYTLTTMGPVLEENASLTVENGNLAMSSNPFTLKDGSKLNLNYVNATSDYTIVLLGSGGKNGFSAEGAVATIENCIFYTTDPAAVATNASKQPWKCDIIISGSKITCDGTNAYYQYDNCPVYMNVNGNLAIEDSVITGQRQGVMVRTGTATIKNTTIISTGDYNRYDCVDAGKYENQAWADGNNVPAGALVVGNRESNAYNYETNVTLENCIITSQYIEEVPAIYIWGNATEEIGAALTVDEFTWTNKTGNLAGDPAGAYGDVTVNLPDGYTLVDTYEELSTAVAGGGVYSSIE